MWDVIAAAAIDALNIAALNIATRAYIQKNSKRLVDNIFQTSPFEAIIRRDQAITSLAASTGSSFTDAATAYDVATTLGAAFDTPDP